METRQINLALQGGGAHGAFTWGVLDRLLDEDWIEIAGITGTSAGALNGAALKAGLAKGAGHAGRQAARENLDYVWGRVGQVSESRLARWFFPMLPVPAPMQRMAELFSPAAWVEGMTRLFSPYDYGPFYRNPLKSIVDDLPYDGINARRGPLLFISATNVRTGRIRVFSEKEVTPDVILASACLPTLFRAIEFKDPATGQIEAYWDGGYTGNPALFPLYDADLPGDIVVVNINPMSRDAIPKSPAAIADRINEISFNSSLLRELRALQFMKGMIAQGKIKDMTLKAINLHMIMDDALMNDLSARSKILPGPGMLGRMKAAGQDAADRWLSECSSCIGVRDSYDLEPIFGPAIRPSVRAAEKAAEKAAELAGA
ncbi:patatin-like phospholipase family protein [Paracoccus sp. p4-l81]|uniref:patatin-like phospholipase family protein n=1 Tax=unclassified Paracoccus (in: a-proteobacteria) TaxID=2688777 RepID=UPI0035B73BDC